MNYNSDLPKLKNNKKSKKNYIIIISVCIISFIVIIGLSYAYYLPRYAGNEEVSRSIFKTEDGTIEIEGIIDFNSFSLIPGHEITAKFKVTNIGYTNINSYTLKFSELVNELTIPEELVYFITCTDENANNCTGKDIMALPVTPGSILTAGSLNRNEYHTYIFTLKFIDTGSLQDYNKNKKVELKLGIDL